MMHQSRAGAVGKGVVGGIFLAVVFFASIFSVQVSGQDISITLTPADETWYIVTAGRSARLRECPSVDCKQVTVIQNRTQIHVVGVSEGWAEIQLRDGRRGYVAVFLTSPILPPLPTAVPSAVPVSSPQQPNVPPHKDLPKPCNICK